MDRRLGGPAPATPGIVRVVAFLASLVAFVVVRSLTRGLPWWLSVALAVVAVLVVGRLAGIVALDVAARVLRRRQRTVRRP